MMQIQVNQGDMEKIRTMLDGIKNGERKVMKRAVDATMSTVKKTVSTVARQTLNVYKRDLDKNIGIRKYDYAMSSGSVNIIGASLPIYDFKPVQELDGVRIKIKKKGPSKLLKGAFIAKMPAGTQGVTHTGVFWREWHGFRKPNSIIMKKQWKKMPKMYRLKVHELFTSSLPDAVGDKLPMDEILADAEKNLHKNLDREISAVLRGY